MKGFVVTNKNRQFYDFQNEIFIDNWNKNCINSDFENIKQFIDKDNISIMMLPLTITGFGFIEDVIDLEN